MSRHPNLGLQSQELKPLLSAVAVGQSEEMAVIENNNGIYGGERMASFVDEQSFTALLEIKNALHVDTSWLCGAQRVCVHCRVSRDVTVTTIGVPIQQHMTWEQKFNVPVPLTLIAPRGDPLLLQVQVLSEETRTGAESCTICMSFVLLFV